MRLNIVNGTKQVLVNDAVAGKVYVVRIDKRKASENLISESLYELWDGTVALIRNELAKTILLRFGGGAYSAVIVGSPLSLCFILEEVKELTVVV